MLHWLTVWEVVGVALRNREQANKIDLTLLYVIDSTRLSQGSAHSEGAADTILASRRSVDVSSLIRRLFLSSLHSRFDVPLCAAIPAHLPA